MASIKISDLKPAGSELFSDSESYMSELGDSELGIINGGGISLAVLGIAGLLFITSIIFAPDAQ
jgi:hypothetical protein